MRVRSRRPTGLAKSQKSKVANDHRMKGRDWVTPQNLSLSPMSTDSPHDII